MTPPPGTVTMAASERGTPLMETKRIEEIMIPLDQYPHLHLQQPLKDAIREMEKCEIEAYGRKTVPRVTLVFNDEHQLVGVARRRDILRGLEPEFLVHKPIAIRKSLFDVEYDPNLSELSYDHLVSGILERSNLPIEDVMLPVEVTLDYNDHIIKAIYEIVDSNISVLPVMKDNKVVGVARSVDVFREIAVIILGEEEVNKISCDGKNCCDNG